MNSLIYHGGGHPRNTFAGGNGGGVAVNRYTLPFGSVSSIVLDTFIKPPRNGSFPSDGMGYGIGVNSHIKEFVTVYSRFTSNSAITTCTLQLRHLTASGTRTIQLTTAAQGTFLASQVTTFPDSSSANRYFMGALSTIDIAVVAGEMLYVVCSQSSVLSVNGVVCHLVLEED